MHRRRMYGALLSHSATLGGEGALQGLGYDMLAASHWPELGGRPKENWDKLEHELKMEDKEEKLEGEAATCYASW